MKAELGSGGGDDAPQLEQGEKEGAVIVRISGEGQFELPDEDAERLNELDNEAVAAVEAGDEAELPRALGADARAGREATAGARRRRAGASPT